MRTRPNGWWRGPLPDESRPSLMGLRVDLEIASPAADAGACGLSRCNYANCVLGPGMVWVGVGRPVANIRSTEEDGDRNRCSSSRISNTAVTLGPDSKHLKEQSLHLYSWSVLVTSL
jgi:hypothetical protein